MMTGNQQDQQQPHDYQYTDDSLALVPHTEASSYEEQQSTERVHEATLAVSTSINANSYS